MFGIHSDIINKTTSYDDGFCGVDTHLLVNWINTNSIG